VAINKAEGIIKAENPRAVFSAPRRGQRLEDQNSGNLTVNHFSAKRIVSQTIDAP
jgi:hypothetical protein